ncbi:MAG: isocitrate lyase/phosphoenolpyruvate mutase family protein [Xanthomonadaceae bacterium]|nr:isocitrate lyase/phosphoenolpyruvate mutase family protein [Xanthomonadaceae bacterium]
MSKQAEHARRFRELHRKGDPLILFNVWDAGSAKVVAETGAQALATGSWSVAAAHGFEDGEKIPLTLALANLQRIVAAADLPVTADLESGYGDVGATVQQAIRLGAIGFNLEDSIASKRELYSVEAQCERIRYARASADGIVAGAFINARTDVFLIAHPSEHTDEMVTTALERARAYADAGADGFFVPGLIDEGKIARVCAESPLPVNVMARPGATPPPRFAELGVARVSYGPHPYRIAMDALREAALAAQRSESSRQ